MRTRHIPAGLSGRRILLRLTAALAGCMLAACAIALSAAAESPSATAGECRTERSQDTIAAISDDGEFTLKSGRAVRLADIALPEPARQDRRALSWLKSLSGSAVEVGIVESRPDRWGRVAAELALPGGIDVAELLVAEGFAMVSAGERDALCRPGLLAFEAQARVQQRGLWADAAARPLAAADLEALEKRVGHFALVEGRVRSVGERAQRSYLNFGRFGQPGFTVTIPKRSWSRLRSQGISADKLRGRTVRVRGILESWRGVAMEIVVPAMLEIVDDKNP